MVMMMLVLSAKTANCACGGVIMKIMIIMVIMMMVMVL